MTNLNLDSITSVPALDMPSEVLADVDSVRIFTGLDELNYMNATFLGFVLGFAGGYFFTFSEEHPKVDILAKTIISSLTVILIHSVCSSNITISENVEAMTLIRLFLGAGLIGSVGGSLYKYKSSHTEDDEIEINIE